MERYREIEKNLIKKNRKQIWSKFVKGVKDYKLINENDKIAVCISGGKDSFILAKCMQELQRHGIFKFELEFICMDPGYNEENMNHILDNAKLMNIDLHVFKTPVFKIADMSLGKSPCYLCARMRRGHLYNKAKELGCNKIALGHHMDDVIETVMMNIIYNGNFSSMPPKLTSDNFSGMELIRPLYYVKEKDIISFKNSNDLDFIDCACSLAKREVVGARKEVKQLIKEMEKLNSDVAKNIFKSTENVNLKMLLANKKW